MIKTGRQFTPGLIDSVPIKTRDKETGRTYVRIGSCDAKTLCELSGNADVEFEEEIIEGDLFINIGSGSHTFYIDVNLSANNSKMPTDPNPGAFVIKKLVWIDYPFPRPAQVTFSLESYKKNKDKFFFEEGSFIVVSRSEEWYGVKSTDVVFEIQEQPTDIGVAYSILYDYVKEKTDARIWHDTKSSAFMKAREVILDEAFYASPVQTIIKYIPDFRKGKPDVETMTFLRWRAAIGIDKVEANNMPATPDMYFYFSMIAGLFGPHVNALSKYTGAGPEKVVLVDHWLPLFDAMIDEWRKDRYIQHTVASFYRCVRASPFNLNHLLSIVKGLCYAGLVEDEVMAVTMLRNELYRQWKEESANGVTPSQVDYKIAVREVLLTMGRFKIQ